MDHADEIIRLIERVLEHLDQCQPSADTSRPKP
jgi:hypothetical protein